MKNLMFFTGIMTATVSWTVEALLENHIVAAMALAAAVLMIAAGLILEGMEK